MQLKANLLIKAFRQNFWLNLVLLAVIFLCLIYPFYPLIRYEIKTLFKNNAKSPLSIFQKGDNSNLSNPVVKTERQKLKDTYPKNAFVQIDKIEVFAPIFDGGEESSEWILEKGVWHYPETADFGHKGNAVIFGHRFRYMPPSSLSFYLLDKLSYGDEIKIDQGEKEYTYKVIDSKVLESYDWSISDQDLSKSLLTLVTCTPRFTTSKRLVVTAQLISSK